MAHKVLKNAGALWTGQLIYLICMMLWTALVARYVGPRLYGIYTYAQSQVAIILLFVNLGFQDLLSRDIAQQPVLYLSYRQYARRISLLLGASLLGGLVVASLIRHGVDSIYGMIVGAVAANGLITALSVVDMALIYGRESMGYAMIAQSVNAILTLATGAIGICLGFQFPTIILASTGCSALGLFLLSRFSRYLLSELGQAAQSAEITWNGAVELVRKSLPFWTLALVGGVSTNVGPLLLGVLGQSETMIGHYGAAMRIWGLIATVPALINVALSPALCRTFATRRDDFPRIFQSAWRYYFIITVPMAAIVWLTAGNIITLFFGQKFAPSIALLRILGLSLLNGVGYVAGATMVAIHREKALAIIRWAFLLVMAVAGLWAIPRYGAEGLCWCMCGVTALGFVGFSTILFRLLRVRFPWVWCAKTIIAAILMFFVAHRVSGYTSDNLFLTTGSAVLTYILAHLAIRTVSLEDGAAIRNAILAR